MKNGAYICPEDNNDKGFVKGNTIYWIKDSVNSSNAIVVNSNGKINDGEGAPKTRMEVCLRPIIQVRYK